MRARGGSDLTTNARMHACPHLECGLWGKAGRVGVAVVEGAKQPESHSGQGRCGRQRLIVTRQKSFTSHPPSSRSCSFPPHEEYIRSFLTTSAATAPSVAFSPSRKAGPSRLSLSCFSPLSNFLLIYFWWFWKWRDCDRPRPAIYFMFLETIRTAYAHVRD